MKPSPSPRGPLPFPILKQASGEQVSKPHPVPDPASSQAPQPPLSAQPSSVGPYKDNVTMRCGAPTNNVNFALR